MYDGSISGNQATASWLGVLVYHYNGSISGISHRLARSASVRWIDFR